jgi:hypothetical protein
MNANRSPAPIFSALNPISDAPKSFFASFFTRSRIVIMLIIILLIFIGVSLYVYWDKIVTYFKPPPPPPPPAPREPPPVNQAPPPIIQAPPPQANIVESVLPERREVFNISENRYTFYDAEPLCKALGAEIATYDQIKQAFNDGGDWCNYGWTAGQMALYPTQNDTWQKLQAGPVEQRMSCGKVGVNGGYFDNPELRFGVNCYGVKPVQKNHDASVVSNGDNYPETPDMIEFDKKVAKFRSLSDTIGVLPFKKNKWND